MLTIIVVDINDYPSNLTVSHSNIKYWLTNEIRKQSDGFIVSVERSSNLIKATLFSGKEKS